MKAAGSGVATRPGAKQRVPLHCNIRHHVIRINRGTMFSVGSAPRLYLGNRNASPTVRVDSLQRSLEIVRGQTDMPESEVAV
jgi:hypothetical protein